MRYLGLARIELEDLEEEEEEEGGRTRTFNLLKNQRTEEEEEALEVYENVQPIVDQLIELCLKT